MSGVGIRVKRSGFKEGLVWRREWMSGRREVVGRDAIQNLTGAGYVVETKGGGRDESSICQ